MALREDRAQSGGATFELDRFTWDGPDRLLVSGRFSGLAITTPQDPVLLAYGAEAVHELAVAPDTVAQPPDDAGRWSASFAWREAPAAFASADLRFGEHIVELPRPGPEPFGAAVVRVRSVRPAPARDTVAEPAGSAALRLRTELLRAEQTIADLRADAERVETELSRARQDLEAERAARAEETSRFRAGLEGLKKLARDELIAQRAGVHKLRVAVQNAEDQAATDSEAIQRLRSELAAVIAARDDAEAEARTLRAESENARADAQALRRELEVVRERAEELDSGHQRLQSVAETRQAEVDRLNRRLVAIREAFRDGE